MADVDHQPESPREKWLRRIGLTLDTIRWINRLHTAEGLVEKVIEIIKDHLDHH